MPKPKTRKSTLAEVVEAEELPDYVSENETMEETEEVMDDDEEMEDEEEMDDEEEGEEELDDEEDEEEESEEEVVIPKKKATKKLTKVVKKPVVAAKASIRGNSTQKQSAIPAKKTIAKSKPKPAPLQLKGLKPPTTADVVAEVLAAQKRTRTEEPNVIDIADKKLAQLIVPEFACHVGNKWYVRTSKYYGRDYVCIRLWDEKGSPTTKGANLDIELLPKVLEALQLLYDTMNAMA